MLVIGVALAAVVAGGQGVRPVAVAADVPHATARDWVRRFRRRAGIVAAAFAAAVVEVSGLAVSVPATSSAALILGMMSAAFAAVRGRAGPALPSPWAFVAVVTGGGLLATTTSPLSIVLGRRRLIVPVP